MITFIGDVGLDYYVKQDQYLLGGCALNVATHFKRNSQAQATLIYPSSLEANDHIEKHCTDLGIKTIPLKRNGPLPCQKIELDENGEKNFVAYEAGVLKDFKFCSDELELIQNIGGEIVMPLFSQIMPFVNQIIEANTRAKYIFDFHDAADFFYDFEKLRPFLSRASLSLFGLNSHAADLKNKLLHCEHDLIVTQGSDEIIYHSKNEHIRYQPKPVKQMIDSTGAGDAFLGSFLAFRLQYSIEESVMRASEYAKSVLLKIGSV